MACEIPKTSLGDAVVLMPNVDAYVMKFRVYAELFKRSVLLTCKFLAHLVGVEVELEGTKKELAACKDELSDLRSRFEALQRVSTVLGDLQRLEGSDCTW